MRSSRSASQMCAFLLALFLAGCVAISPAAPEPQQDAVCSQGADDDVDAVALLQTGLKVREGATAMTAGAAGGRARERQQRGCPTTLPETDLEGLQLMMDQPRYMYVVAVTDDSETNPTSWHYASRQNFREQWGGEVGYVMYWQESDAPDAPWTTTPASVFDQDTATKRRGCPPGEPCDNSLHAWKFELYKGHWLAFNFLCNYDLVGNELLWGGGQEADDELLAYAWSIIENQGGGLEKYPLVKQHVGAYNNTCPWDGGDSMHM